MFLRFAHGSDFDTFVQKNEGKNTPSIVISNYQLHFLSSHIVAFMRHCNGTIQTHILLIKQVIWELRNSQLFNVKSLNDFLLTFVSLAKQCR